MSGNSVDLDDTGLEVVDLDPLNGLKDRPVRAREPNAQITGILRIYDAFLDAPETILQALVDSAIELCGADSAGICLEQPQAPDHMYWHWAAVAGDLSPFAKASLPRHPNACGVCLERGRPQLLHVTQRFYEILGIEAEPVTDGILLPWNVEGARGTIWVLTHGRREAFDSVDLQTMQSLCNFAALAWRHRRSGSEEPPEAAALALAVEVAHLVDRQLQVLADVLDITNAIGKARRKDAPQQNRESPERLDGLVKLLKLTSNGTQVN